MPRLAAALAAVLVLGAAAPADAMIATSFIRDVIHGSMPRYRACASPGTRGTIGVEFTIAASGWVTEASTYRDDIGDDALTTCILETTLHLRFPPIARGGVVRVNYPFRFE
jgi:hypothetical protein